MDQNRSEDHARVTGSDTSPLPPPGLPADRAGQPTTYVSPHVPPEIRAQGTTMGNYAGETPSALPPYSPYAPAPPSPVVATPAAYHDRRAHRTPLLGPLLLILAGVVFLLNNVGVLPWSVWETLGRLWPLILIAIGIDLVIGRRSPLLSMLVVLAVLGAGAAFVAANGDFAGPGALSTAPVNIRLNKATSAHLRVHLGFGNLSIGPLSGDDKLLATGSLDYFETHGAPRQDVSESGDTASVELAERPGGLNFGSNWFNGGRSPGWELELNDSVPLDLDVDSGTGNMTLDLERLQVRALKVDSGTGNATITLPANAGNPTVEVDGGTGNLELLVPASIEAHIEVDSGIGNTNVDARFAKQGEDTYESSGYTTATNKLTIKIDHGIGNLNIRSK